MFWRKIPFVIITLFLISSTGIFVSSVMGNPEGLTEINEAEFWFGSALRAVQSAEKNGVDVQVFVGVLNHALEMLNEAKVFYRLGNVTAAIKSAKDVSSISIQVEADVTSYASFTLTRAEADLQSFVIYNTLAVISSVLAIYAGWRLYKRRYLIKVLDMKPEVKSDES